MEMEIIFTVKHEVPIKLSVSYDKHHPSFGKLK